jgi:hypothetical protein
MSAASEYAAASVVCWDGFECSELGRSPNVMLLGAARRRATACPKAGKGESDGERPKRRRRRGQRGHREKLPNANTTTEPLFGSASGAKHHNGSTVECET